MQSNHHCICGTGLVWVPTHHLRNIPVGAIHGGEDTDGDEIFVGQVQYGAMTLPAKVVARKGLAYFSYNGKEHEARNAEVLCQRTVSWVPASDGCVPPNAVHGAWRDKGEQLYVGRAMHRNKWTVGKIHPSHRGIYIPYGGAEHKYNNYEVLVYH